MNTLRRFLKDETGATAIEYGLIAALVSVAVITVLGTLGQELVNKFDEVATELSEAAPKAAQ